FFLTATCPLGFVKRGVNYNFYDHPDLERDVTPFIVRSLKAQIAMGGRSDVAIVLGTGKLKAYLDRLNAEHGLFGKLVALEHPRFIMQYRRKRVPEYVRKYRSALRAALTGG
ncbi:MAG TPA: uracil-DNA glycosylase family protein, partial [Patescibacteria group bacterium]|nr:uracil-DNA glycosylase family protein [Patescibacteria group bacterium]